MKRKEHVIEAPGRVRTLRCAIYTRKSSDEGLEQPFNSLDAQREAAEAYIDSQRHQGWTVLPERFDDGGYTGANMDRPALQRLVMAVENGDVDCVVVYKVDRLSRSLLDFGRIMETLEQHGTTFVSITQHFNTTTSIGRLTLNILLSFAQFERELISERTRDKMSAARRKGKWVGGTPPLGYDVAPEGGRLVVNEGEAAEVREVFSLLLERGSVIEVVEELSRRGRKTKEWTSRRGRPHAGHAFSKEAVMTIVRNRTYAGQVHYREQTYEGEQAAIIDLGMWERANERLRGAGQATAKMPSNAPLAGLLYCAACGTRMLATYVVKKGRRYRYYVCSTAQRRGWKNCATRSVNAVQIEQAVLERVRALSAGGEGGPAERVREMVERVTYERGEKAVRVRAREEFGGEEVKLPLIRFGHGEKKGYVPRIARLMALAIRCEELIRTGVVTEHAELAQLGHVSRPRMTQIMNLLNLAPQVQQEILFLPETEKPRDTISERAVRRLPTMLDWGAQYEAWTKLRAAVVEPAVDQ